MTAPAFFADQPFVTNVIQPEVVSQAVGPLTFGPFDVSAFQGMRFKGINEGGFSAVLITLTWYDDLTLAQAPTAFNDSGFRQLVINTADSAKFTVPHIADWLVVTMQSLDAGQFKLHWAMAERQNGIEQWAVGAPILLGPVGVSQLNGNTTTYTTPSGGRYAGPFHWVFSASSYAGLFWDIRINVLKPDNTTANLLRATASGPVNLSGYCPPLPLSIVITNATGAAAIPNSVVYADDWRAA